MMDASTKERDAAVAVEESARTFRALRGSAAGRRVYVVGTGPSAAALDSDLLEGAVVVSVNNFGLHPRIEELSPSYHVIADPAYWDGSRPREIETYLRALDFLAAGRGRLLMPSAALSGDGLALYGRLDPLFFRFGGHDSEIDFAETVPPWGQNVLNVALMFCLHLRARDVVLLGFDNGGFMTDFKEQAHFYVESESEAQGDPSLDLMACLRAHLQQLCAIAREASRIGMSISTGSLRGSFRMFPVVDPATLTPARRPLGASGHQDGGASC